MVSDVTANQMFTCRYLNLNNLKVMLPGGLGTPGFALPAAIGRQDGKTRVVKRLLI
jgi:thiamine pyrophosphate-dependent acetolactate synthase large subunit-like protein